MTAIDNPWVLLDELHGKSHSEMINVPTEQTCFAFYGRVSTEDHQDPDASRAWQLANAKKLIEPLRGKIVAQYFDVGQSRSVPWDRRPEAAALLAALRNPARGWTAVVVGEGTRCFFASQFAMTQPRLDHFGVEIWVPELSGKFEAANPGHKMMMTFLGGQSESERQHVQARVRAAMDAQVRHDGRHQGGRAPYGYRVVDGGLHPHPGKAAEGQRLRVLEIDPVTAPVVAMIFDLYLRGEGYTAIAVQLNREHIPCPSASRPEQNRHRRRDGWQASTVRAILVNARYTGYAVFGRTHRESILIDPDDVSVGHVTRFRPSAPGGVVRSDRPAHPAIVDVEKFIQVQLLQRRKGAGGRAARARLDRGRTSLDSGRCHPLRGHVRCAQCERKMETSVRAHATYFRCRTRALAPSAPLPPGHPMTTYVREGHLIEPINAWLVRELSGRDPTELAAELLQRAPDARRPGIGAAERRLADASMRLERYRRAIADGVDPAAVRDAINAAQVDKVTATAELDNLKSLTESDSLPMEDLVAELRDLAGLLSDLDAGAPEVLADLYNALELEVRYDHRDHSADVRAHVSYSVPGKGRVASKRVRGGT